MESDCYHFLLYGLTMLIQGFPVKRGALKRSRSYLVRSEHTRRQVAATRRGDRSLRVNWSATGCSNPLGRYTAATNHFVCTGMENFCENARPDA